MTIHVRAIIATDTPDMKGERFSPEALRQIAEQSVGKGVTVNFAGPVIGIVESAKLIHAHNGQTQVEATLKIEATGSVDGGMTPVYHIPGGGVPVYIVPGGVLEESHFEGDGDNLVRVFDKFKATAFGLTDTPADTHLTPIDLTSQSHSVEPKTP